MNKTEALHVLREQLQPWRERSWSDRRDEIGGSQRFEVTAESGTWYQGKVQVFWEDKPNGTIPVIASVDDGGWRAFVPLTADFILAPDGTFVGSSRSVKQNEPVTDSHPEIMGCTPVGTGHAK